MGTRHLIAVQYKNEYKIAQYGQWDGYPSGQGVDILNFLLIEFNREKFIQALEKTCWLNLEKEYDKLKSDEEIFNERPYLSRDTGADILNILQNSDGLEVLNRIDFAKNSLFCEYAYVIDFDKNTFEVYKGFNKNKLDKSERFYSDKTDENEAYYPVKFLHSFDLDKLPTVKEFLDIVEPDQDE